ncbi:WXG100 family type VII secretion target [Rhodococcus rhodnii]|nr:WXG100 family type VII secretion target [Rhodococcus rhodnii]
MKYGFGEMTALAGEIRGDAGRIGQAQDDLQGFVNGLVSTWESSAQQAYQAEQVKWDQAQRDLMTTLEQIAKTVEQGANDMQQTEARNAAQWNG